MKGPPPLRIVKPRPRIEGGVLQGSERLLILVTPAPCPLQLLVKCSGIALTDHRLVKKLPGHLVAIIVPNPRLCSALSGASNTAPVPMPLASPYLSPFIALKKRPGRPGGPRSCCWRRNAQVQVLRLARTTQSPSNLVPQSHPRGGCRA